MDSGKDGRNSYIDLMKKLGERFKKQKWGWTWAPALAQTELEKALQVGGFGYPVLILFFRVANLVFCHHLFSLACSTYFTIHSSWYIIFGFFYLGRDCWVLSNFW